MTELNEIEYQQTAGESAANFGAGEGILLAAAATVLLAPEAVPVLALGALAVGASAVATTLWGWWS
ncbi:hypothetical protein [Ferrovum sp.]|uniref:hypothetical protein n=1 Tax=Ferrovum sp. TaxID=2609467 RepID=UPI00260FA340|nr:hypothetical protein [Ferrovum sp.]